MRVDLPAPFSPIRACTSPGRNSRETSLFATTPGNRLVMCSITTTGGALVRPARSPFVIDAVPDRSELLRVVRRDDVAVDDLLLVLVDLVDDVLRHQLGVRRRV